MNSIWRFTVPVQDVVEMRMPEGAEILSVKDPHGWGGIRLWAAVDPEAPVVSRILYVVGTGHPCDLKPEFFIGTVEQNGGALIWHVYDGGELPDSA